MASEIIARETIQCARRAHFVVFGILELQAERVYRSAQDPRGESRDTARVDPAGQPRPYRNVRAEMDAHGVLEPRQQPLCPIPLGKPRPVALVREGHGPPSPQLFAAVLVQQDVAGG